MSIATNAAARIRFELLVMYVTANSLTACSTHCLLQNPQRLKPESQRLKPLEPVFGTTEVVLRLSPNRRLSLLFRRAGDWYLTAAPLLSPCSHPTAEPCRLAGGLEARAAPAVPWRGQSEFAPRRPADPPSHNCSMSFLPASRKSLISAARCFPGVAEEIS